MRRFHLEAFLRVRKMTPARRAAALDRVREKLGGLTAAQAETLGARIDLALQLQREALVMTQARRTSNEDTMHAQGARELDQKLDRLLSLFNHTLGEFMELFDGEMAALAKKVREVVFRDGVSPITNQPFVEQHELILVLIHDLRSGEIGEAMTALSLASWVDRLEELNTAYGEHLTRPERVSPEVVRAIDARSYIALVEVVTAVLAIYPTNSPADIEGRQTLLTPLVEQEEQAAWLRARRRSGATDKDPGADSEDELDEEDAPGERED